MTHLLHRLGFVYKKTKVIPGKVDLKKQEQFKKEYEELKQNKKEEDRIYFVDASHPQHILEIGIDKAYLNSPELCKPSFYVCQIPHPLVDVYDT